MRIDVALRDDGVRRDWRCERLPARPLVRQTICLDTLGDADLEIRLRSLRARLPGR